jgi:hypothetical protein
MKLLELIPKLKHFTRIKRKGWKNFLVRSIFTDRSLIECNFDSLQLKEYLFTYEDLIAEDWEIYE